ncbi:MAG: sodium:solute symporter family protein [Dehalobacterium sp.]
MIGAEKMMFFLYLAAIVVVLYQVKIKHHSINEYFIYGRKLSGMSSALLWALAWVGGGHTISLIANANQYGVSAYWYVLGTVTGFLIFAKFLAHRVRTVGDKLNQVTFADIIEDRYDVKCRIVVSIISVLTSILYTAAQIVAISFLLDMTGLLSHQSNVILGTIIFALYTGRGGLIYISRLAYLQTGLIMLGSVLAALYCFQGLNFSQFTYTSYDFYQDISKWGWNNIGVVFISIICSVLSSSDGYLRCLAARGEKESRNGLIGAAILTVAMTAGFLFFGLYSNLNFTEPLSTFQVITLLWTELPDMMKGIFLITLLAVILSTADISLLTATAGITKDFYYRFIDSRADQKVLLRVNYLATALAALSAILFALMVNDLFLLVLWAFKITTICLTVPVVGAYYWPKANAKGAFWSIISSLGSAGIWYGSGLSLSTGISELWVGLAVSFSVYTAGGLICSSTEECYRKSQAFCSVEKGTGLLSNSKITSSLHEEKK